MSISASITHELQSSSSHHALHVIHLQTKQQHFSSRDAFIRLSGIWKDAWRCLPLHTNVLLFEMRSFAPVTGLLTCFCPCRQYSVCPLLGSVTRFSMAISAIDAELPLCSVSIAAPALFLAAVDLMLLLPIPDLTALLCSDVGRNPLLGRRSASAWKGRILKGVTHSVCERKLKRKLLSSPEKALCFAFAWTVKLPELARRPLLSLQVAAAAAANQASGEAARLGEKERERERESECTQGKRNNGRRTKCWY